MKSYRLGKTPEELSALSNKKRSAAKKYMSDNPNSTNKDILSYVQGKFNSSGLSPHVLASLRQELRKEASAQNIGEGAVRQAAEVVDMAKHKKLHNKNQGIPTEQEMATELQLLVEDLLGPAGMKLVKTITLDMESHELQITPKDSPFTISFADKPADS
jgi:hypothetical protein